MQNSKNKRNHLSLLKDDRGVTLLEVIAVIAVLSVVLASVVAFLLTGAKMSAQVSNGAKFSIRELTAVEFINKALYKADVNDELQQDAYDQDAYDSNTGRYSKLYISSSGVNATIYSDEGTVYYQVGEGSATSLSSGKIYFYINGRTVTYVLNDTQHTVYLRITQ